MSGTQTDVFAQMMPLFIDDVIIYDSDHSALIKGEVWNTKQVYTTNSSSRLTGRGGV